MSDRSLSILSGIAKGVEKGVANLHNISLAKEKLRKEREEFTLNKKVKNAQLDVLEAKTSPEAMRESRAIFDMSVKKHEATMKKDEVLTNIAEIREQKQAMSLRKDQKILVASGISSLEDTGLSTEEATKRFLSPDQPSMFDVNAQDPFLSALGTAAREKTGLTKEQAKKKAFGDKDVKETDAEFIKRTSNEADRDAAKGSAADTQSTEQSPFSEYPDAFKEDGVWKVIQDGKKYRIEA